MEVFLGWVCTRFNTVDAQTLVGIFQHLTMQLGKKFPLLYCRLKRLLSTKHASTANRILTLV